MTGPVAKAHPELFHYTTAAGLQGIIESQQLFATNIGFLNDAEEHTGYFNRRLLHILEDPVKLAYEELERSADNKAAIAKLGGMTAVAASRAQHLVEKIRESTIRFNEPYVTSLCVPSAKDPDDGLLSQWRGYGVDGGYAVVFDTEGLTELLDAERQTFHYQSFAWGNVEYFDQDTRVKAKHPETWQLEQVVQTAVHRFILTDEASDIEPLFDPITYLSCTHKHRGFREEAEVRIVALPSNAEMYAVAKADGDDRPIKPVHFRAKDGVLVPFIKLFEGVSGKKNSLPIKRVIVGPHQDRSKREAAVKAILRKFGIGADVVVSDIPYLGH